MKDLTRLSEIECDLSAKIKEIEQKTKVSEVFSSISNIALKDEYNLQVAYYKEQGKIIENYSDDSDLYKYIDSEYANRLDYYNEKINCIKIDSSTVLEDAIENYKKSMQIKRQLDEDLKDCSIKKARLANKRRNFKHR